MPIPAPTIACTVPLSSERKTNCGWTPAPWNQPSITSWLRHWRKPISGSSAISASDGGRFAGREGRVGLDEQDVRVVEQVPLLEGAVPHAPVGEGEVEVAALDQDDEVLVVVHLGEAQVDARPRRAEAAQHGRQDVLADALVRADAQRPGGAGGERGEVGLGGLQPRDDRVRVTQQQAAGLGERDGPRPARPVEQPLADDALERGDLLADRGLRVAEPARGLAEGALGSDRLERREVPQFHA